MSRRVTLGTPRLHLRVTDSTNTRARELALAGAPHGTLVTAREQSAGRGRQGRTWTAPAGRALLCSVVVRDPPALLSLLAGVAVAEAVGPEAMLKWPNDVLLGGRKVAGILVEGRPQEGWGVVGVGINVAVRPGELPPELADRAGTLGLEADAIEPVLDRLLTALARWLAAPMRCWRPCEPVTRCLVRRSPGPAARRAAPASTSTGDCWLRPPPAARRSTPARSTWAVSAREAGWARAHPHAMVRRGPEAPAYSVPPRAIPSGSADRRTRRRSASHR